jgi:hypothetical protein
VVKSEIDYVIPISRRIGETDSIYESVDRQPSVKRFGRGHLGIR